MEKAKRTRRTFSSEQKQNILAEIAAGNKLVDVAKKYEMQPSQLSQWKSKQGGGKKKTAGRPASKNAVSKVRVSAPAASTSGSSHINIVELEHMIGKLTVENILLRRQLEELSAK